jgi:hypothetical protein
VQTVTLYERSILGSSLETERKVVTQNFTNCIKRGLKICAFTKYFRTVNSRRKIWLGRVARMGKMYCTRCRTNSKDDMLYSFG